MNIDSFLNDKKSVASIGRLLWDKDLVSGLNGNVSVRVDDAKILLTGKGTCLGFLKEEDVVLLAMDGTPLEQREGSSEKRLHLDIYTHFPEVKAIIHTHTTYTNAFFWKNDVFKPKTFEAEHVLGDVRGVPQTTINVEDTAPVIEEFRVNRIVALRRHGIVSAGKDLFECLLKIQTLEEQIKMEAFSVFFDKDVIAGRGAV